MKLTAKKTPAKAAPAVTRAPKPAASSKTPERQWTAVTDAYAKAKPGEDDLPDYKKKAIPRGTVLTALLTGEAEDHWRIKDGVVDGKKLPRTIRVIDKSQWALLPDEAAPDDAPAVTVEAPTLPAPTVAEAPVVETPAATSTLCARGVRRLIPFLKPHYQLREEGLVTAGRWEIIPAARAVVAHEETGVGPGSTLLEKLPGLPKAVFASEIHSGASDSYLLCFPWEGFFTYQKSRSTGLVLPLRNTLIGNQGFGAVAYEKIAEKAAAAGISEDDWRFLQSEFEPINRFDPELFATDIERIFTLLRGKTVIVLTLNERFGADGGLLKQHGRVNAIVSQHAAAHDVALIDVGEFVNGVDDLVQPKDNGSTYKPEIYQAIAARVVELMAERGAGKSAAAAPAFA